MRDEPYKDSYFNFPVNNPPCADDHTARELDAASRGSLRIIMARTARAQNKTDAIVNAYEKSGGEWVMRFSSRGFFGKSGVRSDKREGDGATPSGVYTFGRAFGVSDDPGSAIPYTRAGDNDVWVDDPDSKYYNTWTKGNSSGADWKSAERIIEYPVQYKYAIAINYNTPDIVPGKGSAIFLHCSSGGPTAGCVSVPEAAMVYFLSFIDQDAKIYIKGD